MLGNPKIVPKFSPIVDVSHVKLVTFLTIIRDLAYIHLTHESKPVIYHAGNIGNFWGYLRATTTDSIQIVKHLSFPKRVKRRHKQLSRPKLDILYLQTTNNQEKQRKLKFPKEKQKG